MITEHGPADLTTRVQSWVTEGLISAEQAQAILDSEAQRASRPETGHETATPTEHRPERSPLLVEALGYLGGVLILTAALLIGAQVWQELSVGGRVALLGATAVLLGAAGAAVPRRLGPTASRLRSVLWTLSVVAVAGTLAVLAVDGLDWRDAGPAVLAAGGAAVTAGVMWWLERTSLLQVALFVSLVATVVAVTSQSDDETSVSLAAWGLSAAWFALGWGGLVAPRRTAYVVGSVGALLALQPALAMSEGWALALSLVTVVVLVAIAMALGDLVVLAVAAVGALRVLPQAASEWFPGALSAPVALLVVGVLLVLAAIRTARRRAAHGPHRVS